MAHLDTCSAQTRRTARTKRTWRKANILDGACSVDPCRRLGTDGGIEVSFGFSPRPDRPASHRAFFCLGLCCDGARAVTDGPSGLALGFEEIDPRLHGLGSGESAPADKEGFEVPGIDRVVDHVVTLVGRNHDFIKPEFERLNEHAASGVRRETSRGGGMLEALRLIS